MAAQAIYYQGDREPNLRVTLSRAGVAIPLGASTVSFKLYRKGSENLAPLIDAAAVVVDALAGVVEYQWAANDLDLYGRLSGVFIIDWSGKDEGVPDTGYIDIKVMVLGS